MKANKHSIERLHRYRNALYRLKNMGLVKVFSDNLADAVGVTATQVRKDFSILGPIGNKRGGYLVDELIVKLDAMLGKDKMQNVIVAGAGNLGTALMHYPGFEKEGITIVAAFETNLAKLDRATSVPVLPLVELARFVQANDIKIGIIAVPDAEAQRVLDLMILSGIRGILNFASVRLWAPQDCVVNNVHLDLELEKVIYFTNAA